MNNYELKMDVSNEVLSLIGWSEEQMAEYRYNIAEMWLEKVQGFEYDASTQIMLHSEFWNWWAMQWRKRDRQFQRNFGHITDQEFLTNQYKVTHSAITIKYYNSSTLSAGYDQLITKMIENNHKLKLREYDCTRVG